MQHAAPSRLRNPVAAFAAGLLLVACSASGSTAPDCETADQCDRGETCVEGACVEGAVDTGSEDTSADTSRLDTGSEDTSADADPADTGAEDTAVADTDPADTAVDDTTVADTAVDDTTDTTVDDTTVADTSADTDPTDTTVDDTTDTTVEDTTPICPEIPLLDFNADLASSEWLIVGDAYREPAGWLELTGLAGGQQGAIFYLGSVLSRGDTEISLRVSTGQCILPGPCDSLADGADGFALSIFGVGGVVELANLLAEARPGEGLGYAVTPRAVDAFHIEFDTYHNAIDPTLGNHVAITLNGDPTNHLLWTETPTLENNAWHDIVLRIAGVHVTVLMDGVTVIDADVPGLDFKGGYIGFTGSTGGSTNYHRIDDLQIVQACTR
jgi:hypothetical protein